MMAFCASEHFAVMFHSLLSSLLSPFDYDTINVLLLFIFFLYFTVLHQLLIFQNFFSMV